MTNKPYISILCPSTRTGGLDHTFETLKRQKFQDFELLLVDSLYYYRKDLIEEQQSKCSFKIKHLKQLETATDLAHCINNALIRAEGHLLYFLPDYTCLEAECLQ